MASSLAPSQGGSGGRQKEDQKLIEIVGEIVDEELQAWNSKPFEANKNPAPIIEGKLYVSNILAVRNPSKLERLKITHILNTMGPQSRSGKKFYEKKLKETFRAYHVFSAMDEENYDLLGNHWDEARNFLDAALFSSLRAQCIFMAHQNSFDLKLAVRTVASRRAASLRNVGFQKQLVRMSLSPTLRNRQSEPAPPSAPTQMIKRENASLKMCMTERYPRLSPPPAPHSDQRFLTVGGQRYHVEIRAVSNINCINKDGTHEDDNPKKKGGEGSVERGSSVLSPDDTKSTKRLRDQRQG
eukprot:jgi/Bigna1/134223/aug1.24_g8931